MYAGPVLRGANRQAYPDTSPSLQVGAGVFGETKEVESKKNVFIIVYYMIYHVYIVQRN